MKRKEIKSVDYKLFEMLKGNKKFNLTEQEIMMISKESLVETILEYISLERQNKG